MSDWSSDVCSSDLAQQVAIDFGERAERAGDEAAGQHEGGDGAAGYRPRRDAFCPVPEQGGDRAEEEADDGRGDERAQADAALRGREIALYRGAEPFGLARFLPEGLDDRSEEHTSELQSLMRISYAVFCLKKKNTNNKQLSKEHITTCVG